MQFFNFVKVIFGSVFRFTKQLKWGTAVHGEVQINNEPTVIVSVVLIRNNILVSHVSSLMESKI